MGPLSRLVAAVLFCAALPAAAVERPVVGGDDQAAVEGAPTERLFEVFEEGVLTERDPVKAALFLASNGVHARMKAADGPRFESIFRQATEMADLNRVLTEHPNPGPMREALAARAGFDLLADTPGFLAWTKQKLPHADQKTVRAAVLEWDTLSPDLQKAIAAQGAKPEAWARQSLHARSAALAQVSAKALTEFMATVPKTPKELEALLARARKLDGILENSDRHKLWDFYNRASDAVTGLETARKLAGKNPAPAVKAALAEATKAGSLDAMLGSLGAAFDGLKPRGGAPEPEAAAAVRRAGPGTADQRFTPEQRATYTEMLKHSLIEQMKGTAAGDRLREFYKKEPFNLVVKPMEGGTMGLYSPRDNTVSVSEDLILKFVRGQGRAVGDLLQDPEIFRQVSQAVLSTVVHEGIHQEQEAWRRDRNLPHWYVVEHEVEAKSREAAFVLEKGSKDEAYAKFMADPEMQKKLSFVREASLIANELRRDPVAFGERIRTAYYPGVVSIETQARWAAQDPAWMREYQRGIAAELARREKLTPAERAALDSKTVPQPDRSVHSPSEAVALVSTFKTAELRERVRAISQYVSDKEAGRVSAASDYAAFVSRDRRTGVEVGGVLAMVTTPKRTGNLALGDRGGDGSPPPPPPVLKGRLAAPPPALAKPPLLRPDPPKRPAAALQSTLPVVPRGHEDCQNPTHGHPRSQWP